MSKLYYTTGYKYRVAERFEVELEYAPFLGVGPDSEFPKTIMVIAQNTHSHIERRRDGLFLVLYKDYCWDGATWALDSKNFRRPSACHDALLEFIGLGLLHADPWKKYADNFLIKLCKEDGMWLPRRKWVYRAVRLLGDPKGSKPRKVYSAP